MKKFITLAIFALLCIPAFSQADTTAIFQMADSLNKLGGSFFKEKKYSDAFDMYTKIAEITKDIDDGNNIRYADALNNIGVMYYYNADYQNALKYNMKVLEIRKNIYGEDDPDYAQSLNNIGIAYYKMGNYQSALKYFLLGEEITKKTLGEENYQYALLLNNIGAIYSKIGDEQNSLKYKIQALEIQKNIFGESSPEYAFGLNNIATTYSQIEDNQNALKYYFQALEIWLNTYGENHLYCATTIKNIGVVYNNMGDYQNALKYFLQALEIEEKIVGENHPIHAQSLHNIGHTYFFLEDYQNAIKTIKKATDINKHNLAKNFSFMTAQEREAYWNANNENFSNNLKYNYKIPNDTLATKTSYDSELITKGLLLASEISLTNTIMDSGDTALISEYETLKKVHLQLNDELEKPIAERIYNCDSLENEIQNMERHIMEKSKEFGDVTHFIKIDWKEVQNSLNPNDVAIEFSNFTEKDTTRYLALVLTKDMEAPICVPLFEQSEMQKLQRGIVPA